MNLKHIGNVNDYDVADALNAFVRHAGHDDVTVEFAAGVASLHGRVASARARLALTELIGAHDGVESVVDHLAVTRPESAPVTPAS
jgi:osmotically-inducible protein OsmY